MHRRVLPLLLTLILALLAVLPSLNSLLSSTGESCEDCSCAGEESEDGSNEQLPCPPQCAHCECAVFASVVVLESPLTFSLPAFSLIDERFTTPLLISLEEPSPPFLPPRA
jgi:hypothetical protein